MPQTRRQLVFFILGGFFLTNAVIAELTGGKLFEIPVSIFGSNVVLSIGVLMWPVVFLTTDLINEYFGKPGVRKLTFLAVGMITYAFLVLFAAIRVPTWSESPVTYEAFQMVFGQSQWIIVGSLVAFLTSQFVDVFVFSLVKKATGKRMLWMRATGSTVISQIIDTFLVGYIAFVIPGKLTLPNLIKLSLGNYLFKLSVAIVITPLIYLAHGLIDNYLKKDSANSVHQPSVAQNR